MVEYTSGRRDFEILSPPGASEEEVLPLGAEEVALLPGDSEAMDISAEPSLTRMSHYSSGRSDYDILWPPGARQEPEN